MLFLVATPIGNLGDITYRAVEVLKQVDRILCEDTRHSSVLLAHYEIKKPLLSYHRFNEEKRSEEIVELLKAGEELALISDAGTPGISDPGERLVRLCRSAGIQVSAIPGPCAAITALTLSGFDTTAFQFVGFLPKKTGELKESLLTFLLYPGTTIAYESPHRILGTLRAVHELDPKATVAIARELTKRFEEVIDGCPAEVIERLGGNPKGEFILLIKGSPEVLNEWLKLSPADHVALLQDTYELSKNEAIRLASSQRGMAKSRLYKELT